jgi:hypothetical protein
MKKIFSFLLLMFAFIVSVPTEIKAQTVPPFVFETFAEDIATNADTLYFTPSASLPGFYRYGWFIDFRTITGTRAGTLVIQEDGGNAGANWITVATKAFVAGTADTLLTGYVYGQKQRVRVITTGTQSTGITVKAAYKRDY